MCKRGKTEPRGTHEVYLRKRWVPGADGNILSAKYGAAWARAGPQLDEKNTGRSEAWFWAVAGLLGAATTPEILGMDRFFPGIRDFRQNRQNLRKDCAEFGRFW